MTKVTSGGITIDNGSIVKGENASLNDLNNAFSKYTTELAEGGISEEEMEDYTKLIGNYSQELTQLPINSPTTQSTPQTSTQTTPEVTTQVTPTPQASTQTTPQATAQGTPTPQTSTQTTPQATAQGTPTPQASTQTTPQPTTSFNAAQNTEVQDKLKESKPYSHLQENDKRKFDEVLNKTTSKEDANGLIDKLNGLGNDNDGAIDGFYNQGATDEYGNSEVTEGSNAQKFYTDILGNKTPPIANSPHQEIIDRANNSKVYNNLEPDEKNKFSDMIKTKNKDEANALFDKLDGLGNDNGQIEGFGNNKDEFGNREVKAGTKAEEFYKILGNETPPLVKEQKPANNNYSYKDDTTIKTALENSQLYNSLGSEYGMKEKLEAKLAGAKNTEEAQQMLKEFNGFNKNGNNVVEGFSKGQDLPNVDHDSEADKFLQWLGVTDINYKREYR